MCALVICVLVMCVLVMCVLVMCVLVMCVPVSRLVPSSRVVGNDRGHIFYCSPPGCWQISVTPTHTRPGASLATVARSQEPGARSQEPGDMRHAGRCKREDERILLNCQTINQSTYTTFKYLFSLTNWTVNKCINAQYHGHPIVSKYIFTSQPISWFKTKQKKNIIKGAN